MGLDARKKGQGRPQELPERSKGVEMPVDGTQTCGTTPGLAGSLKRGALRAAVCKPRAELPANRQKIWGTLGRLGGVRGAVPQHARQPGRRTPRELQVASR